jgi:hypothetical protein
MDDFMNSDSFEDFIDELTNDKACSIDNPDCEGCGS